MAYDIFSQLQGPSVPISLFGDADSAGINAGNAQKTPLQAGVEGLISGVETGQRITANNQNAEIRQGQIERQPAQAEMDQQQIELNKKRLEAIEYDNTMKKIESQTAQDTESIDRQIKIQEAEQRLNEVQKKQKNIELGKEIDVIKSNSGRDPKAAANIYLDPKYSDYWAAHPEEQKKGLQLNYGQYADNPEQKELAEYIMFGTAERQLEASLREKEAKGLPLTDAEKDVREAQKKFKGATNLNTIFNEISAKTKLPLSQKQFYAKGNAVPIESDDPTQPVTYKLIFDGEEQKIPLSKAEADIFTFGQNAFRESDPENFGLLRQSMLEKKGDKVNDNNFDVSTKTGPSANGTAAPGTPQPQGTPAPLKTPASGAQFTGMPSPTGNIPSPIGPVQQSSPEPTIDNSAGGPAVTSSGGIQPTQAVPTITSNAPIVSKTSKELEAEKQNLSPEEQKQFDSIAAAPKAPPVTKSGVSFTGDIDLTRASPVELTKAVLNTSYDYTRPKEAFPPTVAPSTGYQRIVQRVRNNPYLKGEPAIVKAVAAAESGGNAKAKSPTGVQGLMQLTRDAAIDASKLVGRRLNRDNERDNAEGGAAYLKYMISRFPGRTDLALAAYNGGEGTIKRAMRLSGSSDFNEIITWLQYESKKPGATVSPAKVKEIAAYPGRVTEYLYSFAQDSDPVWLTQI